MHKLVFFVVWFIITTSMFVATTSVLGVMRSRHVLELQPSLGSHLVSPGGGGGQVNGISTVVEGGDARVDIVASFLERYNSPLQPYDHFGQFIVDTADTYNVDYRLIPAIMMQESGLCKAIPPGSNNCLGFGVHSRGTLMFDTYEEGIDRATRELKENYIDIGLTTPELIMTKYTPSSNGSWANSVNQWIAEMEYNDRDKGRTEKSDADLTEYVQE